MKSLLALVAALGLVSGVYADDCRTVSDYKAEMAAPPVVNIIDDVKLTNDRFDEMLVVVVPETGGLWVRFAKGGCMVRPAIYLGVFPLPTEVPYQAPAPASTPLTPDVST